MLSVDLKPTPDGFIQLHATTVSIDGRALAIAGPSGAGKSGFALRLMAHGAKLVSDDVTWFEAFEDDIIATCPAGLTNQIEARGIGVLMVPTAPAPLAAILDLGQTETRRMPEADCVSIFGQDVPVLHKFETPYFVEAVLTYMRYGRQTEPTT